MTSTVQFENALWAMGLWSVVFSLLGTALMFWLLYLVIRAGVRDGILQARAETRHRGARSDPPITASARLPEMRVE